MMRKNSIKNWAEEDRPREKMLQKGRVTLSSTELLAILIGSGSTKESAVELAKRIIDRAGNLHELGKKDISFFLDFKGIGQAKAVTILAALELGIRRQVEQPVKQPIITCAVDSYNVIGPMLQDLNHEEFWLLCLGSKGKLLSKNKIGQGSMNKVIVDSKVIFKTALDNNAAMIVLIHNHPSGSLKPSKLDIELTIKVIRAGKVMDIAVMDHLIIGRSDFYSFRDSNTELF